MDIVFEISYKCTERCEEITENFVKKEKLHLQCGGI